MYSVDAVINHAGFIGQTCRKENVEKTHCLSLYPDWHKLFQVLHFEYVVYLLGLFVRTLAPYQTVAVFALGYLGMAEKLDVSYTEELFK